MTFCYAPWTNVDISPTGKISPCCKFQGSTPTYSTLLDYTSSDFLKNIKQEFEKGAWPTGCERCQIEEANGIESKRQLDQQRWQQHYDSYNLNSNQFITASVAFGNTCNLKCITCGPNSSSRWQTEYNQIYGKNVLPVKFYKKDFANEFVSQAPDIVHLDIPGGEPFLSGVPEQKQLLQYYIDSGRAANVSLHYTTNATLFPDSEWWDLWQHFKEIDMQLSMDGIESRYEYMRFPAEWPHVLDNVNLYVQKQSQLTNFRLSVSHTVSAYNIYYLDEFFTWCYNQQLPRPWLGRVHTPVHMRPTVWPESVRAVIAEHLSSSQWADVKNWATVLRSTDDSDQFELFREKLHQHDQYRQLNFSSIFPELAPYI